MTRQSLDALRNTLTVTWPGQIEADAKAFLLKTARDGHQAIMLQQRARSGIPPDFDAYANTPGNPALQTVKLPGPVVYSYDYRREIVEVALGALIRSSPVESGEYVASHMIFVNGAQVERLPDPLPRAAVVMIANPVPYSRRLEVGKTKSGRDFVLQVEPRIYERVAKGVLIPRFGNAVRIRFIYTQLPGAYKAVGGLSSHYQTTAFGGGRHLSKKALQGILHRRRRDQRGEVVRAPAIVFESYVS